MNESTRRGFLGMAGAGALAVGAAAVASPAVAVSAPETHRRRGGEGGPLVAYVDDAAAGSLSLMVGEREVVVHDPKLVDQLLAAAGR